MEASGEGAMGTLEASSATVACEPRIGMFGTTEEPTGGADRGTGGMVAAIACMRFKSLMILPAWLWCQRARICMFLVAWPSNCAGDGTG